MTVLRNPPAQTLRGRPRDPAVDASITAATLAVLGEVGYGGLTFEAVAQRAGCHRPALYRRFASKQALVLALVRSLLHQLDPAPTSDGDPREDLIRHASNAARFLRGESAGAVLGLAEARRGDPELANALDDLYHGERFFYEQALRRAAGREMADEEHHLVADALIGAIVFRFLHCNADLAPKEIEVLVDQALRTVGAR